MRPEALEKQPFELAVKQMVDDWFVHYAVRKIKTKRVNSLPPFRYFSGLKIAELLVLASSVVSRSFNGKYIAKVLQYHLIVNVKGNYRFNCFLQTEVKKMEIL